MKQGGSGAFRSNFPIDFDKNMLGNWSREDLEPSAMSLLMLIRKCKENEKNMAMCAVCYKKKNNQHLHL